MKTLILICFLYIVVISSFAQTVILDQFKGNTHYYNSYKIPFRLYVPKISDDDGKPGLVLSLHGIGGSGNDNVTQLGLLASYWALPIVQSEYPCFVLVPQCPVGIDWTNKLVYENVNDMMDSLMSIYPIDPARIYVTGASMGGNGTWSMLDKYPEKFAAAVPVCGWYGYSNDFIERIKNIPVWNFHGQIDPTVNTENSRSMVFAYDRIGYRFVFPICFYKNCNYLTDEEFQDIVDGPYDYLYSEIPGVYHDAWNTAYTDPFLYKWMLSKVRRTEGVIALSGFDSYGQISGTTKISWTAQNPIDSIEVWLSPDLESSWIRIGKSVASAGSITFNSELVKDCAFGILKLLARNSKGYSNGATRSVPQAINNAGNSGPFLKIAPGCYLRQPAILADSISVNMMLGDAENDPLTIRVLYSTNDGNTFAAVDTLNMKTQIEYQTYWLVLKNLRYSKEARVKIEVTDGNLFASYVSAKFENKKGIKETNSTKEIIDSNRSMVLLQNYPNPFSSSTTIAWQLAKESRASLIIFDLLGREVAIPVDEQRPAGKYEIQFNAATLPKGVYFYQLKAGDFMLTRKMILMK